MPSTMPRVQRLPSFDKMCCLKEALFRLENRLPLMKTICRFKEGTSLIIVELDSPFHGRPVQITNSYGELRRYSEELFINRIWAGAIEGTHEIINDPNVLKNRINYATTVQRKEAERLYMNKLQRRQAFINKNFPRKP